MCRPLYPTRASLLSVSMVLVRRTQALARPLFRLPTTKKALSGVYDNASLWLTLMDEEYTHLNKFLEIN